MVASPDPGTSTPDISLDTDISTLPDNVTPIRPEYPVPDDWRQFTNRPVLVSNREPDIDLTTVEDLRPKFPNPRAGQAVQVRMPEELLRMVDKLLQRDGFPYDTRADLIRDGAYYLTKALTDKYALSDPQLLSLLYEARVRADASHALAWEAKLDATTAAVRDTLTMLVNYGGLAECHRQLCEWWDEAEKIPNPWRRDHYLMAIRDLAITKAVVICLQKQGYTVPAGLLPPAPTTHKGWCVCVNSPLASQSDCDCGFRTKDDADATAQPE